MHTRCNLNRCGGALWAAALLLGVAGGCSTGTDLGGVRLPNAAPDTRVTGQPPTLLEASYAARFQWTGADPDGRIRGYQWKISDNGTDGISPQDTMTVDPLTGAVIHPWRFTAGTDSTFLVLADQPDFPGDTTSPRSYRSHSLFVRAVDEKGAVDPTPAYISFTSTTIVPTSRVNFPGLTGTAAFPVPPTVNIGWDGQDPDSELRVPTKVRFLWIPAKDTSGNWITQQYRYNQIYHEVLSYDDPRWSPWLPYLAQSEDRIVSIPMAAANEFFLFATQVQDTAGAVSVGFGYQTEVANVVVRVGDFLPTVTISETYLGQTMSSEDNDAVAGGQPLNFIWTASARDYNGNIVSMRHGWDIVDVNDPNDPGWAVPPGLGEQNRQAVERSFSEGLHAFVLRVEDDSGAVRVMKWTLRVIPFVDRAYQLPLLVLDQLYDKDSNAWTSQDRRPLNEQAYRNAYWHFLAEGAGGVADLNWTRDWMNHTATVTYENLVGYKAVLCYAFADISQTMFKDFRPTATTEKFVWLTPYQRQGGNLMLVGASSMESFLQKRTDYMTPLVFDTREDPNYSIFGQSYVAAFGTLTLPNGEIVQRGPRMYPYATAGIAALDWTSPPSKHIYGRATFTNVDRSKLCAGLKGLVLSPEFKASHLIGPGVMPDTMYTNPEIDWRDYEAAAVDTLSLFDEQAFSFDADEFVDGNITTRITPIIPQECSDDTYASLNVPNGLCIEPMFKGIARLDWMREQQRARGDAEWPQSRYDAATLEAGCGVMALTGYEGRPQSSARTNGMVFGYLSYKMVPRKPYKVADVYWGFDPYRFEGEGSRKAIRWVLQYFGLQINQ
jgi:hypothetical protein